VGIYAGEVFAATQKTDRCLVRVAILLFASAEQVIVQCAR
jgi:hypothetical protein